MARLGNYKYMLVPPLTALRWAAEGVEIVYKNDFNLLSVIGKKGAVQEA